MQFIKKLASVDTAVPRHLVRGELPETKKAWSDILKIAVPSIVEIVLASLISSVDTVMVGTLGKNALAAVSLSVQPRMLMLGIFFATNVGITTIVARRKGERRRDAANATLKNAIMLVSLLSMLMLALSLLIAEPLMRLAGGNTETPDDAQVLASSVSYFKIISLSLPVQVLSMAINASLRGIGNTKVTLQVNMVSNIVNVVFNYLLIQGKFGFPALGVDGAAIATVIGIVTSAFLALAAVTRGNNGFLHITLRDKWRIDVGAIKGILKIGGNAMLEQMSLRFGFFMYSKIIYSMGVMMFAAHNIAAQFFTLTFSFADGVSVAATTLVGQSLGEQRPDKSYMYGALSLRLVLFISLLLGVFIALFRFPLSAVFINQKTANADAVIAIAAQTLLVVIFLQPFQMSAAVLSSCLRGAGDNLFVASVMCICVSILRPLLTFIPVDLLHLSLPLVWLVSLSEIVLRTGLFGVRFRGLKWINKKV